MAGLFKRRGVRAATTKASPISGENIIAASGNIIPPAGEAWAVLSCSASSIVVSGANSSAIAKLNGGYNPNLKTHRFYITNTIYLSSGSYASVLKTRFPSSAVRSQLLNGGESATPPEGEIWLVTYIKSLQTLVGGVGVTSDETAVNFYIDNTVTLKNTAGSGAYRFFSAINVNDSAVRDVEGQFGNHQVLAVWAQAASLAPSATLSHTPASGQVWICHYVAQGQTLSIRLGGVTDLALSSGAKANLYALAYKSSPNLVLSNGSLTNTVFVASARIL